MLLALTDGLSALAAFLLAYQARFGLRLPPARALGMMLIALPLWTAIFSAFGLYRMHHYSPGEEFRRLFSAITVSITVIVAGAFWLRSPFSRTWLLTSWLFAVVLVMTTRRLWHFWMGRERARGALSLRTVIVGGNEEAMRIATQLREQPHAGFRPIGFITPDGRGGDGMPVLGELTDLPRLIRQEALECVFVASTSLTNEQVRFLTRATRGSGAELRVSANVYDVLSSRLSVQPVGDLLALSLAPVRLTGFQAMLKRTFDIVVAGSVVLVTLPLWITIAAAIRLDSRGSVLFRQDRVTKGGRAFTMYKFRTMVSHGEGLLRERNIDPTVPFFKLGPDDPRLTRVGRLLRRSSLDELPQLLNVIRGDMSLVGPRPLPADQVAANLELLMPRHEVRAGVTGWWQIRGRSDVGVEEALRMDLFYIDNWSLGLDLYILTKTIGAIVKGRGAY